MPAHRIHHLALYIGSCGKMYIACLNRSMPRAETAFCCQSMKSFTNCQMQLWSSCKSEGVGLCHSMHLGIAIFKVDDP